MLYKILCILYKEVEHPQILIFAVSPETCTNQEIN